MKVSVEKPGPPSEIAEHSGVKGMKWGVRQERGRAANKAVKREFNQKFITSGDKAREIRRARARSNLAFTKYANEKDPVKRKQLKQVYLSHPDRATALRTTRGEKVALGILTGAIVTAPVAGVIGGALAGQTAQRRFIERKQARGGYRK